MSTHERRLLLELEKPKSASLEELAKLTGLEQPTVMRAALGLKERGFVDVLELRRSIASPTEEGLAYVRDGLPERRVLVALAKHGPATIKVAATRAGLPSELVSLALGWLRRKGWVELVQRDGEVVLTLTKAGEEALVKKLADEEVLARLAEVGSLAIDELPADLRAELGVLRKRRLVELKERVSRRLKLTNLGERALALGVELVEEVSELTHDLLVSGRWREVKLRRYDVLAPGAPLHPARIHPQQRVIDELREILLEMGFVEVKGPLVESEFWNFDALFQAQDHPAREIHDSLSLAKPSRTKLPSLALVRRVATAHERGVAGSKGWGYEFDLDVSRRPVMCSQTTAATVRYLAKRPKPPVKVFCIEKVYRHEKIDYKHLAEFYQVEGIVMAPKLTLRDMLGYLKQILVKLGLPKVRFRPGYFPYTEPSVEADVYFPEKREWLEVLGAGMFRPELLYPLGIRYPVAAWGMGFGRLAMIKMGIEDIRDLYNNDLEWLAKRAEV